MSSLKVVPVKGIGNLPDSFVANYEGVNIDLKDSVDRSNHHNESQVVVSCEHDSLFDDDFNVTAYKTQDGYHLDIAVNSEVKIGLWKDGRILLDYSEKTGHWMMKAYSDGKEWAFCEPKAVVKVITSGLKCFAAKDAKKFGFAKAAMLLSDSIMSDSKKTSKSGEKNILDSATLYGTDSDCVLSNIGYSENPNTPFFDY